jgi:HK97 family phage major capsid protein
MTVLQRIGQLHRDQEVSAKAQDFCELARWTMFAKGNTEAAVRAAQAAKANGRVVDVLKAAVAPGTTQHGTFAAPLAFQELADGFLQSLRNIGLFDGALPFAKQLPINLQVVVTTIGATAASVGEGQSQMISKIQLAATALNPRRAVAIVVASDELLRAGGALASRLFGAELQRAVAFETDARFLSLITNGVAATTSSGSDSFGIAQDFANALGALSLGNGSKVFVAMNPNDVRHVSVQIASNGERAFPTVNIDGGDYAGATIVPSDAVSGQIVAFDASQIAANGNDIELDSSNQAAIQMDSAPDSPPSASTPATSFWQNNLTGLRATRYFGCERLRVGAVSVISGVSYGSANSPA